MTAGLRERKKLKTRAAIQNDPRADLIETVDEAMSHLEAGLPLDWESRKFR